jgi:uncharacterized protein (TIGR02284 family)
MTDTETAKVIEGLVDTLENGHKGFEDAAEKLEQDGRADLASEMRELSEQRGRMASELREMVDSNGGSMGNGEGSIPGALHRSWMALRDANA